MNNEKRIIEIDGVKVEIDLRTAKRVDVFRVGDAVKLLVKERSYSSNEVTSTDIKYGVIVDFEEFESLPTICVAYVCNGYSDKGISLAYINSASKNRYEMIPATSDEILHLDRASVVKYFKDEIAKREAEIADLKIKENYFNTKFGAVFGGQGS